MIGRRGRECEAGCVFLAKGLVYAFWALLFLLSLCLFFSPYTVEAREVMENGQEKTNTHCSAEEENAFAAFLRESYAQTSSQKRHKSERMRSLTRAAHTYGFQKGFQWHYAQILAAVRKHADTFTKIFSFERLLLDDRVLPPVIFAQGPVTELSSDTLARQVQTEYRIVKKARIVTQPPTFEHYLHADTRVLQPNAVFYPKNGAEKAVWEEELKRGWQEGGEHAKRYFSEAMERMTEDFRGILLAKRLAEEGYLRLPVLDSEHVGIQVGESVLTLDEAIFRLVLPASFAETLQERDLP